MNIVLFSHCKGQVANIRVTRPRLCGVVAILALVVPGISAYLGFQYAGYLLDQENSPVSTALYEQVTDQKQQVDFAIKDAEVNLNALALQLGKMHARVVRLDALGSRLTEMAGLQKGEFDFTQPPPLGGPLEVSQLENQTVPDFLTSLQELSTKLADRSEQLSVLELMLMNRKLQNNILPSGRPVDSGWVSSDFGFRSDPFSGKREHHDGVDFAGKEGEDVMTVAAGVVTWSDRRNGYGNLVEVNHGNGYITRYGHNKEILVEIGEKVDKGQVIAKMGSTGRSTGPHVHFEVIHNGRVVNPSRYTQAQR